MKTTEAAEQTQPGGKIIATREFWRCSQCGSGAVRLYGPAIFDPNTNEVIEFEPNSATENYCADCDEICTVNQHTEEISADDSRAPMMVDPWQISERGEIRDSNGLRVLAVEIMECRAQRDAMFAVLLEWRKTGALNSVDALRVVTLALADQADAS